MARCGWVDKSLAPPAIRQVEPCPHLFCRYEVGSRSGRTYTVELRALGEPPAAACTCVDFRINGLGTCKHVEAVLAWAERTRKQAWRTALRDGSPVVDLVPSAEGATLAVERNREKLPLPLQPLFDRSGRLTAPPPDLAACLRPPWKALWTPEKTGALAPLMAEPAVIAPAVLTTLASLLSGGLSR